MQPIERYGVAALLFLIVTIGAVVLWDRSEAQGPGGLEVAAAERSGPGPELAGLSRGTRGAPRAPQDPLGARPGPRQVPAANSHKAGAPAGLELQDRSWETGSAPVNLPERKPSQAQPEPRPQQQPQRQPGGKAVLAGGQPAGGKQVAKGQGRGAGGTLLEPVLPKPEPVPKPRTYTVAPGDTLGQIAQDQLGGVRHLKALQAANPTVRAESMSVGTVLVLPAVEKGAPARPDAVADAPERKPTPAATPTGRSYTVQPGDSYWRIAARELGDGNRHGELAALNPGVGSVLQVGAVLRLPTGTKASTGAAARPKLEEAVASAEPALRAKKGVVR